MTVANTGDRPIQVGSHYHFAETNAALQFDRDKARGHRLDIAAGTAVRFEPGQTREVSLVPVRRQARGLRLPPAGDGQDLDPRPLEVQMFDFIKKRVLKEHMKLVAQNYKALAYVSAFLPAELSKRYSQVVADVQRAWEPGTKLNDQQFTALYDINRQLRRAYDLSPARLAGMKSFDEEFKPLLGWEGYYSQHL